MKVLLVASVLLLAGCGGPPDQPPPAAEPEPRPSVAVTRWSPKTELFVEYPMLQAGKVSRFAVHLTDLASFRPLEKANVAVELDHGGGAVERFSVGSPSRPGIFGVDVTPARSGQPAMTIRVRSASLEDSHALGPVSVYGSQAAPGDFSGGAGADSESGAVSFLKEQQWTLDFATQIVGSTSMQESLRVPAMVEPRSGGRMVVTAPVSGRLVPSIKLPTLGTKVRQGEQLGAILPLWAGPLDRSSLQLAIDEAKVSMDSAGRQRERAERLLAVGAIPARRVEEANAQQTVAEARLSAAEERMAYYEATRRDAPHSESAASFFVRAHLAGVVTSVFATEGAHVEEGEVLLEVAATDTVHVSAALPESQASVLRTLQGAEVELAQEDVVLPVQELVATASVVDPETRTLKATYLVDNRRQRLAIGQSTFLRLFTSRSIEAPTIPNAALIDDAGRPIVFVQVSGESFDQRPVTVGNRRGADVQIVEGLSAGERVVSQGAYLVRLASMSTQAPAHGHVH